jgi:hypothetical protein
VFPFQYYIRNMTDDAHMHSVMHQDLKNVVSMDYHYKNGDLYYADVSAKIIYRLDLKHDSYSSKLTRDQFHETYYGRNSRLSVTS